MGPGDQAFVRWAKRYISLHDAKRVLVAYKDARIIAVDNRAGTFRILNEDVARYPERTLEAAADNVRPERKRWNQLIDEERQRRLATKRSVPDQWEKQERVELAIAKLDLKKNDAGR